MLRRLLPLVCVLGSLSSTGFAQPLPDRVPLRGVIVDEAGRPVPSAVLIIRRQDDTGPTRFWGAEVRADETGHFAIPNAETGHYFINIDAPNYASVVNQAFDWKTGTPDARFQITRLTRLTLRVVGTQGTPLINTPLWLRLRSADGTLRLERLSTNERGELNLADVIPTTYALVVVGANGVAWPSGVSVNAETANAPLEVRLQEGATLQIKATDVSNAALGGASLVLFPQTPEETNRLGGAEADPGDNWALLSVANAPQALVTRDGDGTLEIKHLPPGVYAGRLSAAGYGTLPRDLTLEAGKTTLWEATFPKRSAASLTLHVRDASDKPVANTRIALRLLSLGANGAFVDAPDNGIDPNMMPDSPFSSGTGNRVAETDDKGNVTLYPLLAGSFRIYASRPTSQSWLLAPVAPEGTPTDITVSVAGPNTAEVQVP